MLIIKMEPKVDPRRRQERADADMVPMDRMSRSNLPEQVHYREFNAWKYPERLAMYDQSQKPNDGGE